MASSLANSELTGPSSKFKISFYMKINEWDFSFHNPNLRDSEKFSRLFWEMKSDLGPFILLNIKQ